MVTLLLAATAATTPVYLDCYNEGRLGLPPADFTLVLNESEGTVVQTDKVRPTTLKASFGPEAVAFQKSYFDYEVSRVTLKWTRESRGLGLVRNQTGFCKLSQPPKDRAF